MIKPNLCYYWDASTGQTTSPKLVGALIEFLRNNLNNDPEILIGEADASAMKTRHVFKMLGYEELAKDKEVELLNLSSAPIVKCNTNIGSTKLELSFSKKLLESDLLINVPKLKYHRLPKITCAMKNIFGAIAKPHKYSYHPNLTDIIVAANKIIHSDIILVDGLIVLGNYPKIMKTLLLGQNAVTVDKICSKIIGFNPNEVGYLKLAEKEKMGEKNKPIMVGDITLDELKKNFPKVSYWKQRLSWGLQLWMVNTYARIIGDTVPPMLLSE
ncbi:MAG: DUF362 domain-containing protein [Candidatus Hodarchaeota archaeon]